MFKVSGVVSLKSQTDKKFKIQLVATNADFERIILLLLFASNDCLNREILSSDLTA
jgi:hypothetical protein